MRTKLLLAIGLMMIVLTEGCRCDNPNIDPQAAKAFSEQRQEGLMEIQNGLLTEQNKQLTRIANALHGIKEEKPETVRVSIDSKLIQEFYDQQTSK